MADRILYNAGDRLKESIKFTTRNSKEDFKQYNWLAYHHVDAAAQSYFTLPDEVKIAASSQGPAVRLPVMLYADMANKHGHKGVVCVDEERATPLEDDEPFASTKEEAKEKAERLWRKHLHKTVENHLQACAAQRAMGSAPVAASHFTARAFKLLGMTDPGSMIFDTAQSEVNKMKSDAADKKQDETQRQMQQLQEQVAELIRQNSRLQAKQEAEDKAAKEAARAEKLAAKEK